MPDPVAQRIADILERRRDRARLLRESRLAWECVATTFRDLEHSLGDLASHRSAPARLSSAVDALRAADVPGRVERDVLPRLQRVERRFARRRLNIGVAGRARVGKSTLLQSVSGLGEGQIPTGDNLSVTAVRSRIFHSAVHSRAMVSFHDWPSFRSSVLQPYFERLGWGSPPNSARAFANIRLPAVSTAASDYSVLEGLRDRVRDMQLALESYEPHLASGVREIPLDELRAFVAYPTAVEERDGNPGRRYLAVREAEIECPFPGISVQSLGLIDLPGMGEIVAAGEDRHVAGLEDEVDVVLLVVKPPRVLEWDLECAKALDVIREARCGAEAQDFALIVLNSGGASESQIAALDGSIRKKLTDEGGTFRFQILRVNAIDADDVREQLTVPVLGHLAERLAVMDKAVWEYAEAGLSAVVADARGLLEVVERALSEQVPHTTPAQLLVVRMARDLLGTLAVRLHGAVNSRFEAARVAAAEDPQFEDAVGACYSRVREWLADGVGRGEEAFVTEAVKAVIVSQGSGYAGNELNRVRVHIASEFTGLDDHLEAKVRELWMEVWATVGPAFGRAATSDARGGLRAFADDLRASGCEALARSVDDLLSLRLDYRTHFHPRLRRQLDVLTPQVRDPETGDPKPRISVHPDLDGAQEMLRLVREHGERAAHEAQNALLRDLGLPVQVLHAALEQFDDAFIRGGAVEDEFLRFALERRDEIWPEHFAELDQAHRLFHASRAAAAAARSSLSNLHGVSK